MTTLLHGRRFGRLTVVAMTNERKGKSIVWQCHCRCGNKDARIASRDLLHIRTGVRKGCGACADSKHPLYYIWRGIITRCNDSDNASYKNYGGRGIKICQEWAEEFLAFVEYVGARPSLDHSLDRIDVNGNYEPGNVRWATPIEQANNKRPLTPQTSAEAIIAIYFSKNSVQSLATEHKLSYKTIQNIRSMCYSQSATNIIVAELMARAKSRMTAS